MMLSILATMACGQPTEFDTADLADEKRTSGYYFPARDCTSPGTAWPGPSTSGACGDWNGDGSVSGIEVDYWIVACGGTVNLPNQGYVEGLYPDRCGDTLLSLCTCPVAGRWPGGTQLPAA